jgi:hypothetical protein
MCLVLVLTTQVPQKVVVVDILESQEATLELVVLVVVRMRTAVQRVLEGRQVLEVL